MTIPEQYSQFSSSEIRGRIRNINKLISDLLNGRNPGQLSSPEESQLSEYHRQKDEQFILALKARKAGDPTIKAGIVGKADEPLHECSRNWVQILFDVSITDRNYMQQAPFQALQKVYLDNLMSLIDNPDYFIPESPEAYIIRTMRETSDVAFKAREAQ